MIETSKGGMLLVKQKESHEWNTRVFLVLDGDKPVCVEPDGSYISWNIYSEGSVPLSHETWPKQVVWVRRRVWVRDEASMVVGFIGGGVEISCECLTFTELAKEWEMSLDFCETWEGCHDK